MASFCSPPDVTRRPLLVPVAMCLAIALGTSACASGPSPQPTWPDVDVLPTQAPADLDRDTSTSALRRGSDGLTYIVGGLDEGSEVGDTFLGRYSGEWPLEGQPRPPMAAGQIVRVIDGETAIVQMLYAFPNTDIEALEITWSEEEIGREDLGKGVARVIAVRGDEDYPEEVDLPLGKNLGVHPGDIYALVSQRGEDRGALSPVDVQLGQRLAGICLVQRVEDGQASCRIWRGTALHPLPVQVREGDTALFLEHTFGAPPRQALMQFGPIEGDKGGELRRYLIDQMGQYVETHVSANLSVEPVEVALDPRSETFYRAEYAVDYRGLPQIYVGGAIVERDGEDHLVINYTAIGPSSGPGMIAAPPEHGIDFGPVDDIDGAMLRRICGTLYSGVLINRGQTSEALMHLRQLLSDETLQGSARWHMRDQYAMRWGALGYVSEALWSVLEDEAIARARQDERAELNALGTRVRLYDLLDRPERAFEASDKYLTRQRARSGKGEAGAPLTSAVAMHAEMSMSAGKHDEAMALVGELRAMCPDGCEGDLYNMLSGVYWATPPAQTEMEKSLLSLLNELAGSREEALSTLRIYQGLSAMREGRFEEALVSFLESTRLFEARSSTPGVARAKYFTFLAYLGMKDPIKAYETASDVLEIAGELRDYGVASRVYERLTSVYLSLDLDQAPQTSARIALRVLTSVYESQIANGDLGESSETLFSIGTLFFKLGSADNAKSVFQRAVAFSIRATRFDIASMSHLTLGLLARSQGDMETFAQEIGRAQLMARISGDEDVIDAIDRALTPSSQPSEPRDPVDNQMF